MINKIVCTSPEVIVEFSGGKKLKLLTSVNLYSFERSRNFFPQTETKLSDYKSRYNRAMQRM